MIGIYGANGFIGRHLVRRLAGSEHLVKAVSRRFDEHFVESLKGAVDFAEVDIREPMDVASTLNGVKTVVQLISTSSPGMKNDYAVADISENVIPHIQFLQSCIRSGVTRYIFLSSGGTVYGPDAIIPTRETDATNPINSHGLTKLIIEKYIHMHGHIDNLEYFILRVSNPFGPGQEFRKGQGLIPAVLEQVKKDLPVRIFGNGTAKRDYIYIDDLIDAIECSVLLPGTHKATLNIGSGEVRSVADVVETLERYKGQKFKREYSEARSTDVEIASLDIGLAKATLGWSPKTTFEDGIRMTLQGQD